MCFWLWYPPWLGNLLRRYTRLLHPHHDLQIRPWYIPEGSSSEKPALITTPMAALTQASSLAPVELSWFSHLKWKPAWLPAPGGKIQFSSATQSCPTLCDPMDCSTPGFPVHHQLLELAQTHVHRIGDAIQPSHPLLSPPALNLSQHQGPNESALHIRWPKYWSFSFSISPSNDYSGLISFRIDWFDLLAVQETLSRVFSNSTVWRHQFLSIQPFLLSSSHMTTGKTIA